MSTGPRRSSGRTCFAASSNCSTVARSQHSGGEKTLVRHWSWAIRSASSSVGAQERCTWRRSACPRRRRRKASIIRRRCSCGWLMVISPSAHSPAQPAVSTLTAVASSGGGSAGSVHSLRPVDADEPVVVDDLAGQQRAHDVDALAQPRVADLLVRPRRAGDVLVGELAGAEGDRQPPGEQLGQRGRRLGDDRRVVALAGRVDDAERHRRRLHRRAQPRPCEARLALALAPGREVVGRPRAPEARVLGLLHGRPAARWARSARARRGCRCRPCRRAYP